MNQTANTNTDAPVEMTDDSYATEVHDAANVPFLKLVLALRKNLEFGELTFRFEKSKCVHQVRSASSRISC